MSSETEWACRYAIQQAKKQSRAEVVLDDLLLGCFRTISQFGIVQLGGWKFDLEELGIEWLAYGDEKGSKVAYSQDVVDILDLASQVARVSGAASVSVEHVLVGFAGREDGLIGKLKREYSITSAAWRSAIVDHARGSRQVSIATGAKPAAELREYLTPEEAADILAIHVQTLRGHVRSGKLPALRLAGERAIRIRRADLEKVFEPAVQAEETGTK